MTNHTLAPQPNVWGRALFCEDVRRETSGQISLIGCYTSGIATPKLPVILPKLAVYVELMQMASVARREMMVRGYLPGATADKPFFESRVFVEGEVVIQTPNLDVVDDLYPGDRIVRAVTVAICSPIRLTRSGRIIVRAFDDEHYYPLGSMAVTGPPDDEGSVVATDP